jgi:hypothetical protein
MYAAIPIHAVRFKIRKSIKADGTRKELRMINIYRRGIEPHISVSLCPDRSTQPPKNP